MMDAIAEDVAAVGRLDIVPKILEAICRSTGMGFAAVARVTEDRWIACAVRDEISFGLTSGGELELRTTICNEIRDNNVAVVIDHVAEDPLFRDHHTPARYGFQSYISTPIRHRGEFFGTLCAIDPRPALLRDNHTLATFELFAELIGSHLDAAERLALSEAALMDARETSELRDQFIAVLGHDLRNPLAGISGGARLLQKTPLNEKAVWILSQMESSAARMAGLIDNVMDFARGRLGGGFDVDKRACPDLAEVLTQVVDELRTAHPERMIHADISLTEPVSCDHRRVAQMVSNLLSNALTHGASNSPVGVCAHTADGWFELAITNEGEAIPADTMPRLFQPFSRASVKASQQGLGLGLYIASEIAKAHGGTLTATSDAEQTRFTFRMPVA